MKLLHCEAIKTGNVYSLIIMVPDVSPIYNELADNWYTQLSRWTGWNELVDQKQTHYCT